MKNLTAAGLVAVSVCVASTQCAVAASPDPGSPKLKVLFSFSGTHDGANPFGGVIQDKSGAFYGTTGAGGTAGENGTVYKLSPPLAGETKWTETVLYRFKGGDDGQNPDAALVMDPSGALFGTTQWGGVGGYNGTVFKLTPVDGKTLWHETVIYRFGDADGTDPVSSLALDPSGALYGTACGCGIGTYSKGTVFQLTPPAKGSKSWTYSIIHAFTGGNDGGTPYPGVVRDASGALYGATGGGGTKNTGTVYRLTPPKAGETVWREKVLHSFTGYGDGAYPHGGVTIDPATGTLYGTTQAGGTQPFGNGSGVVYSLTPPAPGGKEWAFTTLYGFNGKTDGGQPASGVVLGASGTIFGTTALGGDLANCPANPGCGVVYQLVPPQSGSSTWTQSVVHAFSGGKDGNTPWSGLLDVAGTLYGTTMQGGAHNAGEVYRLNP